MEQDHRNQMMASTNHLIKRTSSSQPPADTGKKAKTQQPNKLTEIFRSVDEKNNTQIVGQAGSFGNSGTLSSTHNFIRALQLTNSSQKGSNIQLKPSSASRRRQTPVQNQHPNQVHHNSVMNNQYQTTIP